MTTVEEAREVAEWRERHGQCHHANSVRVQCLISNGGVQVRHQCSDCGIAFGQPEKQSSHTKGLPFFDNDLWRTKEQEKNEPIKTIRDRHQKLKERKEDSWWQNYNRLLLTPEWAAKRSLIFKRESSVCEGCGQKPAVEVHHKTYQHVGHEFLFELAAVCIDCHNRLHPKEIASLEELPCAGCRFQAGNEHGEPMCGKFNQSVLEALSMEGDCGPDHHGLEALR